METQAADPAVELIPGGKPKYVATLHLNNDKFTCLAVYGILAYVLYLPHIGNEVVTLRFIR